MADLNYYHGGKSRIGREALSARSFRWIFDRLAAGRDLTSGAHHVELRHPDACARCGRELTVPASIDSGFGPVCAGRLGVEWAERVKGGEFIPLAYMLGGGRSASVVTASSSKGGRFTFRFREAAKRDQDLTRRWFVDVLTGPDNGDDFTWLGTIVEFPPTSDPIPEGSI